jgi:hypothetical protein
MAKSVSESKAKCKEDARRLVSDPAFLYRAMNKIGELGVVGEKRNRLILFLAGTTKDLETPVSVIVKGQSSSGKSNVTRKTLELFPPECVISRSSLSAKAPAHGQGSLAGKILYLQEYRGGKDAQYLLRLQQSEKLISHEFATIRGAGRGTEVSEREGSPVVLTTTTESKVFTDDETRFLSIWIDDSAHQTLAIMQAQVAGANASVEPSLPIWQETARIIGRRKVAFRFPSWFSDIAALVPTEQVRVRRDWERFLTFCKAVALCGSFVSHKKNPDQIAISFPDYCIAYRIVNPALASTIYALHEREIALSEAVRALHKHNKKPVTVAEVTQHLKWEKSLVYKYLDPALQHKLIKQIPGSRQSNQKLLEPEPGAQSGFLPSPKQVLKTIDGVGHEARYVNPLTGKVVLISI